MRLFQHCQFYRYRNLVSQIFRAGQISIDVGGTQRFGTVKTLWYTVDIHSMV
jgi:hypothetical protein